MLKLLRDHRAELDEAALVLPVLLLISVGLVNLAILGFAAVNAGNAANFGARMGSVAQSDPSGIAAASAYQMLSAAPVGTYAVSVSGSGLPGDLLIVQGKLLTHDGRSFVDIKHISILGLPWGVLDTLHELEAVVESDVQALVAALTPQEKSRMNLALGTAMRELIAMRLIREMGETDYSDINPRRNG